MSARWEEAMDAQLDIHRWCESPKGRFVHERWTETLGAKVADQTTLYDQLADRLSAMSFNADPVYVDPDMMTVWEAAEPGFVEEVLQPTDFITPAGFVLLPRPWAMKDRHGKRLCFRGILWAPTEMAYIHPDTGERWENAPSTGIVVALWSYTADRDDYYQPELEHQTPWVLTFVEARSFATHDEGPKGEGYVMRSLQCLWRLMGQTITAPTSERASKAFRRRWERANWPEKRVTVVRLRRPEGPEHDVEHGTVNWSHRWLVGGHWRSQWYASLGVHRQIWISPFVKGPADKPLEVNRVRAFEWVQ